MPLTIFSSIWGFIKAHWEGILLVIVLLGGFAWYKHMAAGQAATVMQLNAAHQAEIDKFNADKIIEDQQHAQEMQQLQATLDTIQTNYVAAQAKLQQQQSEEQLQIVT